MEFFLSELKEKIYFNKTKEYFEEVEKSFYNENYRSAVVMLYSAVIADLLYKLEELKNYYSDEGADRILREINEKRRKNLKSSEWENELINKIYAESQILEEYTMTNLEYLKKIRNFSAHPVLNQDNELVAPSREQTLGLIKEMLKGIFIRPPLFISKITENILDDISSKKEDFLIDKEKFAKYLDKKYYQRIPNNMLINVFKAFWKLTFKTNNEECNKNRKINLEFLIVTMKKYKIKILEDLKNNNEKYNNISEESDILSNLLEFIYYYPEIYSYLTEENRIIIEFFLNNNKKYKLLTYYIYDNFELQLKNLEDDCFYDDYLKQLFEKKLETCENKKILINKYIEIFSRSSCYDLADFNFERFIKPYIEEMDNEQIIKLLEAINLNNQIYNRGKAYFDNNEIIINSKIEWDSINMEKYEKFKYDKSLL